MPNDLDLNLVLAHKDILIVEDEPEIRRLVKRYLAKLNFKREPVEAADGQEAFNKIYQQDFGLIITDIDMPRLKGTELIKKVRTLSKEKQCPIIFMSGSVSKEHLAQMVDLGIRQILAKPFNKEEFGKKVAGALGIRINNS